MDGKTTIKYLQAFIKENDYHPESGKDYFLKLSEEVGELSRAIRKGLKAPHSDEIKGTIMPWLSQTYMGSIWSASSKSNQK